MDVAVTVDPAADIATTRAILRLLLRIDPGLLADDAAALLAWLRPLLGHPELHLEAWLADRLLERGLYGWGDRDVAGFATVPGESYAALARALIEDRPTSTTPPALSLLLHRAAHEGADLARIAAEVVPGLVRVLPDAPEEGGWPRREPSRQQWIDVCFALRKASCAGDVVPPALRPLLSRVWKTILDLNPKLAGNFAERLGSAMGECLDLLFEGAPDPSAKGLDAVSALLYAAEFALKELERAAIASAHRESLVALVEFGLARGARVDDILAVLGRAPRLLPIFEDALRRRDLKLARKLCYNIPSIQARACLDRLLAGPAEPFEELLDAVDICAGALDTEDRQAFAREHQARIRHLIELGVARHLSADAALSLDALGRHVPLDDAAPLVARLVVRRRMSGFCSDNQERLVEAGHVDLLAKTFAVEARAGEATDELFQAAKELSSELLRLGAPEAALCVLESVVSRAPSQPRAELLYNVACAHARLGRIEPTAATLAEAIRLMPSQREEAQDDSDFDLVRSDPAIAALLGD
jgi:hypothetical protein